MNIIQQPDAISLSVNLKKFILGSTEQVSFSLRSGGKTLVAQVYAPNDNDLIEIDAHEIIHSYLSFELRDSGNVYEQSNIVADFTALINATEVSFRVLRGGVDRLADSATNFLMQNFLTWQPNIKPVTYYSPEFLTYYAVVAGKVKLRAYFTDGSDPSQVDYNVADLTAGYAYTIPLQYSVVAGWLGHRLPAYYDVWVENNSGERMTYIQRYYAEDMRSEQEQWVLFENSLGGIDTFRAYGTTTFNGEHTHNLAEIEEVFQEYRIDTERKFQKNTGHLNSEERRWLLDFFPSKSKYLYAGNYLRPIVVTDSNASYGQADAISNYTFTFKYADARPLLNLPRTDVPSDVLHIDVPSVGSFTVPPRLAEFPRLPLSEGALFPVQNPYSEEWATTTASAISDLVAQLLAATSGSGGDVSLITSNDSTPATDSNTFSALRSLAEFINKNKDSDVSAVVNYLQGLKIVGKQLSRIISENEDAGELLDTDVMSALRVISEIGGNNEALKKMFLRKDQEDVAAKHISFEDGIDVKSGVTTDSLTASDGVDVKNGVTTDTLTASANVSSPTATISDKTTTLNLLVQAVADIYDLNVSHVATLFRTTIKDYISSELYTSGLTGSGMKLYKALNGDWNLELDNVVIRKAMTVFELIISKIRAVNGGLVISPANGKVKSVLLTNGIYRLEIEGDMMFVADDLVRCQTFTETGSKYYWVRITSVSGAYVFVNATEFTTSLPTAGDDLVQFGNKTNVLRQGIIYLTASEDGKPRISVLDGVNSTSLAGKTKVISGCLDGVVDSDFPADAQPSGYGLYAQNVFLKGLFVLRNGKSVESEITTTNDAVRTAQSVADAAQTAASAAQTSANNAKTEAEKVRTEYQSDFSVLSGKVESKVSQTDFNALGNRVSSAESTITQLPNQIALSVTESKQYTDGKVDAVQVSARNLLKNTSGIKTYNFTGWQQYFNNISVDAFGLERLKEGGAFTLSALIDSVAGDYPQYITLHIVTASATSGYRRIECNQVNPGNKTLTSGTMTLPADNNVTSAYIRIAQEANATSFAIGSFSRIMLTAGSKATDWSPAPEDVAAEISTAKTAASAAQTAANNAKTDAATAQTAANNAQSSANTANNLLTDIASDNKLTANEKQDTKKEWDTIQSEYSKNIANASEFGILTASYTDAYDSLNSYITPLLSNLATTSNINGSTFRSTFKAYYDARTDLLNAISVKAKDLADAAQTSANNAKTEAEKVRTEYQSDFSVLSGKVESKVSQTDFNALGNRVSSAESSITQLPNQITLSVTESKQYTDEKADAAQTTANQAKTEAEKVRAEYQSAFSILSDKISAEVSSVRDDQAKDTSLLNNPNFNLMNYWQTDNEVKLLTASGKWIFVNNKLFGRKKAFAGVTYDGSRTALFIRNKYILQLNDNLIAKPTFTQNAENLYVPEYFYIKFYYRVKKAGTLAILFEGEDKTGWVPYNSISVVAALSESDTYQTFETGGQWNGTGNFKLSFTGEIYLYGVVLAKDRVASLEENSAGWLTEADGVKIWAASEITMPDGAKVKASSLFDVTADGIFLKSDNIKLEGVVTANENFKILEDGSMEANSGTFSGYLKTRFHLIESSDAAYTTDSARGESGYMIGRELNLKVDWGGSNNGADVILPNDVGYIGSRVILYNGCHPPYTRVTGSIRYSTVRVDDGSLLRGTNVNLVEEELLSYNDPYKIAWISGIIELIGTPEYNGRSVVDLLSWRGAFAAPPASPSNGWLYYDVTANRNYMYWYGEWVEFPVYGDDTDDLRITWKGVLSSAPANPERNWLYVTSVNRYILIYTGEKWENIRSNFDYLNKCGWCILGFSALSYEYYKY